MGIGLAIAGALFQTYSGITSARAQADALKSQAAQADYEAGVLRSQAEQKNVERAEEAVASSYAQQDLVKKAKLVAGQNAAALGGAGIDASSGLGYDLSRANWDQWYSDRQKETANLYAKDRNIRQQQNNMQAEATGLDWAANSYRSQAKSAMRSGLISSLGGLALNLGMMGASGMFGKAGSTAKGASGSTLTYRPTSNISSFGSPGYSYKMNW